MWLQRVGHDLVTEQQPDRGELMGKIAGRKPWRSRTGNLKRYWNTGTSLVIQWLRHHASDAEGTDLIPGLETKIPQAAQNVQK